MVSVFSNVRADLASDFVNKFPDTVVFSEVLERICKETGVKLLTLSGIHYAIEGQWGPVGHLHDCLVKNLTAYSTSAGHGSDLGHGNPCGISLLYSASQYANKSDTDNRENGSVEKSLTSPTSKIHTALNLISKSQYQHPDDKNSDINTEDNSQMDLDENNSDRDADEEDTEYSKSKSNLSNICLNLSNNAGDMVNEPVNKVQKILRTEYDNTDTENIYQGDNKDEEIEKFIREKFLEASIEPVNRGRPRKQPLKGHSNKLFKPASDISPKIGTRRTLFRIQREKLHKKYSLPSKQYQSIEDKLLKRKRGRPKKDPELQSDFPCPDCDFTAKTRNQLGDHKHRIHLATPSKCDLCNKVFPNARYMRRHRSSHVQPQHCCDICGKMYKILKALRDHRKTHEKGYTKPEFPCDLCSKSFCTRYILDCHLKSEHLGQRKSFLCSICGKSFTTKHTLVQHSNVHTGSRPYGCDMCDKSFAYESALRDHKFTHLEEKIFKCENCEKSFKQRSALKMHEKIHKDKKDFTCRECGRGFTQKQALQRHERAHKGDKPFYCKLCGRTFGDASIIRRHMILVHKIHKDSKTWREDIIARGKAVQTQPISLNQSCNNRSKTFEVDDDSTSFDSHTSANHHKQNDMDMMMKDYTAVQVPLHLKVTESSSEQVSASNAVSFSHNLQTSSTRRTNVYDMDSSSPMNYHLSPDSVETVHSSYNYTSTQHSAQSSDDNRTTESRFETQQVLAQTVLPRVDSVLSKRLTEMEPPENLSISSLYTYYTNLASQCIRPSVSQYQNYVSAPDELPSTSQN